MRAKDHVNKNEEKLNAVIGRHWQVRASRCARFADTGPPAFIAWGVYVGELVAPVLLIVGSWTRLGALVVAINMLAAIGIVHMSQLFTLTSSGGWALELQGIYFAASVAIIFLGAGRYSLSGTQGF